MKRCPQCEFVYEDDTNACEMDGSELVPDPQPLPLPVRKNAAARSKWKILAVPAIAGILLVALLFVVYYALTQKPRPRNSNQTVSTTTAQQPAADLISVPTPSLAETPAPEESSPADPISSPPPEKASIAARVNSSPVSNVGGAGRGVIIRLTNGATIQADEAWEKREGIWYRQAGMVTLLKRNRVRGIERAARTRSAASKPEANKSKSEPNHKSESRITSILKKTGRILKKPF